MNMTQFRIILVGLLCLSIINQSARASGIFELSLTSLADSLGRDLRDDCCAWQNVTQQQQQQFPSTSNHIAHNHNHNHHQLPQQHQQQHLQNQNQQQQQQQQQTATCDPSKCQLIIRICVKNYQTQTIEASQCTFGELSAQVLRQQYLIDPFNSASISSDSSATTTTMSNSLPFRYQPSLRGSSSLSVAQAAAFNLRQQQQISSALRPQQQATNIHHQRMLSQTQALPSFFYQPQQSVLPLASTSSSSSSSTRNQQQQQQQLRSGSSLSGQPRALRTVAFNQPISFPFNFTWPGSFSLIIDAWFESPLQQVSANNLVLGGGQSSSPSHHLSSPTTTYDLYKRQLIIKHSMRGWLAVKNEWTNDVHKTDTATLAYSYRVTCQTNYYGEQCNILCRPRDDFYGHYTCSQQGNIVCLPGWQGSYCLEPICSPGCHQDQGNCSRPNECSCRFGWQGPACEQCVLHPGCVHGSCNRPLECICDEGWGGLLCNEDLNYCANHQPCKNDAICSNTFDSNGVGSFTCACAPGFTGRNCDRRLDNQQEQQQTSSVLAAADNYLITSSTSLNTNQQNMSQQSMQQVASTTLEQQQQQQQQQQQPQAQAQLLEKQQKQKPQTKQASLMSTKYTNNHRQQQSGSSSSYIPISQATLAASNQIASQPQALDNWVMIGWAVIMICSILLVVVFSLRTVIEKVSQRGNNNDGNGGGSSQWHHHHHSHNGDASSGQVEDVATLQNQQNLCKSRTSLNVVAHHMMDKSPYDARILSLVDGGHEQLAAGIYGGSTRYCPLPPPQQQHQPGTSNRYQNNNQNNSSLPTKSRRGDNTNKKSHPEQQQQQQQRYQSHHNLHATHENNNNNNNLDSSDTASTSSETLAPPPPYTIAQSTHSYPNLAYQSLSSHYSSAASAHYLPLPATVAPTTTAATTTTATSTGQRAPKLGSSTAAAQVTAISNAIYGSHNPLYGGYSTYAGIPVVAAAAPTNRQQRADVVDGNGSGSGGSNNAAAAAAANQSAHYLIYPVHFMAN